MPAAVQQVGTAVDEHFRESAQRYACFHEKFLARLFETGALGKMQL